MQPLDPLSCAKKLVRCPSVTPDDQGCQQLIGNWLAPRGFQLTSMPFGEVHNLWAKRGSGTPLVIFAGHTDVVPTGDESLWQHPPFAAIENNGLLFGRGVADMKGSIASFLGAVDEISQQRGTLALLLTSDEEGPAKNGTAKVVEALQAQGVVADAIVIGEPTSKRHVGDCVRIGRRGSISAEIHVIGKGGHVAYPKQVQNPIHHVCRAVAKLVAHTWDTGDDNFPPTSLQFTRQTSDSGAGNVVPGDMRLACNLRFSPATDVGTIKQVFADAFDATGLKTSITWNLSAKPFISDNGNLRKTVGEVISRQCGYMPDFSTAGGTSDGRFLIQLSRELIELGPSNSTIHQRNEHLEISELYSLRDIYTELFSELLK